MQDHKTKIKAFALVAAFVILASLGFASPHQSEAGDAADKVAVKQEVQQETKHKTTKTKDKKHNEKDATKQAEESKTPEVKQEEAKPAPPPVVITPDKKSYASPNGYQVMIDGTEINFRSAGVIYMHGYRYTYYSSKDLYHHRTPEWYACDDNIYRTADGHVVVASADHAIGTIVPTPFGTGKVMDKCYGSGTLDIYVNF